MKNQGVWVVLGILLVAICAALFAWWFRMQQSDQVLEFFGGQNAALIRGAKTVEWLDVVSDAELKLGPPIDITDQPGLVHARAALIADVSYDWEAQPGDAEWGFALRFSDRKHNGQCTLLFDLDRRQLLCMENKRRAVIGEKLASGMKELVREVRAGISVENRS